jgi:class 3 adenylate cyclase
MTRPIGQSVRMAAGHDTSFGRPVDPTLAQVIATWCDAGHWAIAWDDQWRYVCISDETLTSAVTDEWVIGEFMFSPASVKARLVGGAGQNSVDELRAWFMRAGGWLLADVTGGREALREMVHPVLRDLVDELEPCDDDAIWLEIPTTHFGSSIGATAVYQRVRDASGRLVGTLAISKPSVGMTTIGMLTAAGDLGHFDRLQHLATAGKRPAAILFADLEGSTQLAKRLPTASYFTLVRRLTRAADRCVVDAGGLVGRHAGDGFVAFFVAETAGSESAATRACISAVRSLQAATTAIAARHDLPDDAITVRAGLHWGATLYIGSIVTSGRSEVTALGDEVNEAARIEACASGGRALASKALLERLNADDAAALDLDPNHVSYTQLADLDTATDKARRDAPAIAVSDIATASH